MQNTKDACARVFKEKEVGWHGWSRVSEGKVVRYKIQEILSVVQGVTYLT